MIETYDLDNDLYVTSMNKSSMGLYDGRMGACIYFFCKYKIYNDQSYYNKANDILESIIENANNISSIKVLDGLSGIVLGIKYLLMNGLIDGNINEICADIDDAIFKRLSFDEDFSTYKFEDLQYIIIYYCNRLNDFDNDQRSIHKMLLVKLINYLYDRIQNIYTYFSTNIFDIDTYLLLYTLSESLQLNIINTKIYNILFDLEPHIIYNYPVLNKSCLFKIFGLHNIIYHLNKSEWTNHFNMLVQKLDLDSMIENELNDSDIYIYNGFPAVFYISEQLYQKRIIKKRINKTHILERIKNPILWQRIVNDSNYRKMHSGLLNGYPGFLLFIYKLEKS